MIQIAERETICSEVTTLRTQYAELCQDAHRVVHQRLNSLIDLQGKVRDVSDQLETLSELVFDGADLDAKLQLKLNPATTRGLRLSVDQCSSSSMTNGESGIHVNSESCTSPLTNGPRTEPLMTAAPMICTTTTECNPDPLINTNQNILTRFHTTPSENSYTDNEQTISGLDTTFERDSLMDAERIVPSLTNVSSTESMMSGEPLSFTPTMSLDPAPSVPDESPGQVLDLTTNPLLEVTDTNPEGVDIGEAEHILRRNIIRIPTNNDKRVATVACHGNELLYNDYNERTRKARLTLIRDFNRPTEKEIINWPEPNTLIGGGDDDWIQDIVYCDILKGYLLLNLSRLRLLREDSSEIEEFNQFPDRTMKRVTCNDSFIYLVVAGGMTSQHGDEIILMNYQKEEKIVKKFRDIIIRRNSRSTATITGEISDVAVNNHGQLIFTYRCERYQEVGVCIYNIDRTGTAWTNVKALLLNDCWHSDLSYTPRTEWCEKLNRFIVVEFLTSHLIMLDQHGQVKGEQVFISGDNARDSPLNLSISNNNMLCIRYDSFINLHRLI